VVLGRNKRIFGQNMILRIFGPKYNLLILTEEGRNDGFVKALGGGGEMKDLELMGLSGIIRKIKGFK